MADKKKLWNKKRVKVPTVLQMEAVECGAACLGMILAYYGKYVPLEELRIECGVSRDGSKASNILKAARKYGLEAKGFRKEPEGLKELPLPMIIFWNFNHFVVLEGIKGNKVYLNDPAMGQRVVSYEEFDQSFTGIALTFKPGPEFKKGGKRPSIWRSLRNRLKGSELAFTYIVLASLFLVIPGLVIPTFSKIFIDNILVKNMTGWLKPLLLAMLIAAVVQAALTWLQKYYLLRMETKLAISNSSKFFMHVFRLPIEFFAQRFPGEVGNRVLLNDKVAEILGRQLSTNLLSVGLIGFYALLMAQYDIVLTGIGVAMAFINLGALKFVSEKRKNSNLRLQQEMGKLLGVSMTGIQMIETLKATGSETDFFEQWSGYQAKVMNAEQELGATNQFLSAIPSFLSLLNNVLILTIGGLRVIEGHLTMGMLVAFQSLMGSFMTPVNQMVNMGRVLQEAEADMKRLDDVLNYQQEKRFEKETDLDSPPKLTGYIEIKNVTFGYNRLEPPLIKDFSLTIKPGQRIAIVGASGSGKSTIAKLVSGLYEPWSGEILFDGKPLKEIPKDVFLNSVAMVDQDIFLFEGTVKDNITMWDPTIPEKDYIKAAKDACIHDDIAARPGGYESNVEEGGANFSGGQRQRLEIARALAINPTILVLDEATSALDPYTEKLIDDNIRKRGCTCIIVAHRLSTIRDCDEIIVLDRGRVVQRGTHEEMKNIDGPYAKLIKM